MLIVRFRFFQIGETQGWPPLDASGASTRPLAYLPRNEKKWIFARKRVKQAVKFVSR